jgi:predicted dehydrogenase
MNRTINWGVIGPGRIANNVASSFHQVPNANLYAVASRDLGKAINFARTFPSIEHSYDSYEKLVKDPKVDAVYIATPHSFHHEITLLCLRHKKAVLCEKPLTLNYKLALEMVNTAKENDVFLMEAMWTRFFPSTLKALELIENGAIGEIKFLRADFGFKSEFDPNSRLFDLKLGGGSLLDIGVYPLFLALMVLGKPVKIKAFCQVASTGADELVNAILKHENGAIANILSSTNVHTPKTAEIMGTNGTIVLHAPWYRSNGLTLKINDHSDQYFDFPYEGHGSSYQIQEVMNCLMNNQKESKLMPHDLSLLMVQVSDEIRKQCGIVYDAD